MTLLYATDIRETGITVVEAETLKKTDIFYEDLYDILISGQKIYNLTANFFGLYARKSEAPENVISNYTSVCSGLVNYTKSKSKTLKVAYNHDSSADYSVDNEDVMIFGTPSNWCIWYKGDYRVISKKQFISCYLEAPNLVIEIEVMGTLGTTKVIKSVLRGKYKITKSQFKRKMLLA